VKKLSILTTIVLANVLTLAVRTSPVFAHPGRTAADGCHYCRTNCDKWGVPWNVRHCHGGTAPTLPLKTEPTPTPTRKPTPTPTPKPKTSLTPTSTPIPTLSPTPTPEPEVKSETTQLSSPPTAGAGTQTKEASTSDALLGLGILAVLGGGAFWLIRSLWRKFKLRKI